MEPITTFTDSELQELYSEFMEHNEESAPDEVKNAYKGLRHAFEEYLSAIQDNEFRQAFKFGYNRGLKAINGLNTTETNNTVRADLFELDSVIVAMELAQEKAAIIADDLTQDYFDMKEAWAIQNYHHHAGVKNHITSDYIYEMQRLIEEARKLWISAWEGIKTQETAAEQSRSEDKAKSPQSSR